MKAALLDFARPPALEATAAPEDRGLARDQVRLLVTTGAGHRHATFRELPRLLAPGTLLVVNRSATVPASLPARRLPPRPGEPFLLNLSTCYGRKLWLAEPRAAADRPGPVELERGEVFRAGELEARLVAFHPQLPRLAFVELAGDAGAAMERTGSPIRYGYLRRPFPAIDRYRTLFGRIPGSAEMPSAGRPFTPRVMDGLRRRGVAVAEVTLHAGVSSLDVESPELEDHPLPPEPFAVPAATAAAVDAARADGRAVVAVGTTVVRALASAWDGARLRPARGFTRLFLHPPRTAEPVDGLISGLHDPRASHLAMLYALASPELVRQAYAEAVHEGYLWHEFGDSHLLLPRAA